VKKSPQRLHAAFTGSKTACDTVTSMTPTPDEPLPATRAFVFTIGGLIFAGWLGMYLLLRARW
jgi:hypothetical protein